MGKTVDEILKKYNNQPTGTSVDEIMKKFKVQGYKPTSYEKKLFGTVDGRKVKNVQAWYDEAWNQRAAEYKAQHGLTEDVLTVKNNLQNYHREKESSDALLEQITKKDTAAKQNKAKQSLTWFTQQAKNEANGKENLYKKYTELGKKTGYTVDNPTQADYDWLVAYSERAKAWDQSHPKGKEPNLNDKLKINKTSGEKNPLVFWEALGQKKEEPQKQLLPKLNKEDPKMKDWMTSGKKGTKGIAELDSDGLTNPEYAKNYIPSAKSNDPTYLKNWNKAINEIRKGRGGVAGFLDSNVGRVSRNMNEAFFGDDAEYQKLDLWKTLEKNPTDKKAIQQLQMLYAGDSKADTKLKKALNVLGTIGGIGMQYSSGSGEANALLNGTNVGAKALQLGSKLGPLGGKVAEGIFKGGITNLTPDLTKAVSNSDNKTTKDVAKNFALNYGLNTAADGGFEAAGYGLKKGINLLKDLRLNNVKSAPEGIGAHLPSGPTGLLPNLKGDYLPQKPNPANLYETGEMVRKLTQLPKNKAPEIAPDLLKSLKLNKAEIDVKPFDPLLLKKGIDINNPKAIEIAKQEVLPDTLSQISTKTKKLKSSPTDLLKKGHAEFVDNLAPLERFDNKVEEVLGRPLKANESAHILGLNSRGADMVAREILTNKMVNETGDVVGNSLKDILGQTNHTAEFDDYLVHRHAPTRMERGEKIFPDEMKVTPEISKAKVAEYEAKYPEFKKMGEEWDKFHRDLVTTQLVDTGLLSKEDAEKMFAANPNYAPMNREFGELEKPGFQNNKKGFANTGNQIKKATGSQRKIISPIESTIINTEKYVKAAKRNRVMQTVIEHITANPEDFKGIAEIVPTETNPEAFKDTLHHALETGGPDAVIEQFNEALSKKPNLTNGNILYGLVNGKKVHVKVESPELLDSLASLNPKAQGAVMKFFGNATRWFKNLTTGVNPVFGLTRNVFRDIPTAFVNSKSTNNPITFSKDLLECFVKSFNPNDELLRSFRAVGGGHSSSVSSGADLLAKTKRQLVPTVGVGAKAKKLPGYLLGGMESLNNALETAPRLAEFKRIAKKGDINSIQKGLYEANDITVNFNKYGNTAKEIDNLVPYFNAAIQGIDKFVRVAKNNPKELVAKGAIAITAPTILAYLLNKDNPNYQQLSNHVKDNYLVFPKGDGTFIKIAKPKELGAIFSSGVERLLREWEQKDPVAFKDFGNYVIDTFVPPTRSIVAPFTDAKSNTNYFDSPIVPGDMQGLSPRYQYDMKTRGLSKWVGDKINYSPKKLDYLIDSYGGIAAETTKGGEDSPLRHPINFLNSKVTADPVYTNDAARDFYDKLKKLQTANKDFKYQGVKGKDLDPALLKMYNNVNSQLSKVRKEQKRIKNDNTLSKTERDDQVKELQKMINELELQALKHQ